MTTQPVDHAPAGAGVSPVDEPASTFSGTTGAPGRLRVGLVAAAALALVVVAAATSFAASSNPPPAGSTGELSVAGQPDADASGDGEARFGGKGFRQITITAISGNDVTLGTPDGWRRTITISSTVELTKGGQAIAVSDLAVGDQIRFRQTRSPDGTYTVTAVAVVVPSIRGHATAVTSSGFKVTTRDGSVWTVAVNASTTYRYGRGTGSLADVQAGDTVRVSGTVTADNQMTALSVKVAGDRAAGVVTAKTASTITIRLRDGSSKTVHVDADTTYRVRGVEAPKLSDIAVDMAIGVSGRSRSDGSIDADLVAARNLRGLGREDRGAGRIAPEGGFELPDGALPGDVDEELFVPIA